MRLDETGIAWRNYLFANSDSIEKDIENFKIRVSLIGDAKEQWMETLLTNEKNRDLVYECKEEIKFQKENLEPIFQEFVDYCNSRNIKTDSIEKMLDDICRFDINSTMYRICCDWEDIGKEAESLWNQLNELSDGEIYYLQDDFCKLFMDKLQSNEPIRRMLMNKGQER